MAMGLGFVLSFGYWCTDFLVIQRAMAADSMSAARRTPLIAAVPKMFFPFLVILPGMIAIGLYQHLGPSGFDWPKAEDGSLNYNAAIPLMLARYFPTGILGVGLTALMASFMSGMAGNVTAFNTVWTYDIYQAYIVRGASDRHYLWVGRLATVFGIAISVGAAYLTTKFNSIMDLLQLVFAFVNAPLLATFLLGMFWKRATGHGAFCGLVSGTVAAVLQHAWTLPAGATAGWKGGWFAAIGDWLNFHGGPFDVLWTYRVEMAQNFWKAIFAWITCFLVTIVVSLMTKPRDDKELVGLVYSLTEKPKEVDVSWYNRPVTFGIIVLAMAVVLNIIFW
jgi:SSS family solute:Na+ symporter